MSEEIDLSQNCGMTIIRDIKKHRVEGIHAAQNVYVFTEAINNKILIILQEGESMVGPLFAPMCAHISIAMEQVDIETARESCINLSVNGVYIGVPKNDIITNEDIQWDQISHGISIDTRNIYGDVTISWVDSSHNREVMGDLIVRNTTGDITNIGVIGTITTNNIGGEVKNFALNVAEERVKRKILQTKRKLKELHKQYKI